MEACVGRSFCPDRITELFPNCPIVRIERPITRPSACKQLAAGAGSMFPDSKPVITTTTTQRECSLVVRTCVVIKHAILRVAGSARSLPVFPPLPFVVSSLGGFSTHRSAASCLYFSSGRGTEVHITEARAGRLECEF